MTGAPLTNPAKLAGKTVLVTGAASGIGRATAELFASLGARVFIADISDGPGQELAAQLGSPHRYVRLDVSDLAAWQRIAAEIGQLDLLILNAGVMSRPVTASMFDNPLDWVRPEAFQRLAAVNMGGVLYGILACMPIMEGRPGATIFAIASVAGVRPYVADPLYAMSKFGVIGLAGSLAPTLQAKGIRLLSVCPSGIDTGLVPPDVREKRIANGSFSPPSHVADALAQIYTEGASGEIWLARSHQAPYRFKLAEVVDMGGVAQGYETKK
jgi:3alpha(or 20beta)-hydroxysteroid dehydrogenase